MRNRYYYIVIVLILIFSCSHKKDLTNPNSRSENGERRFFKWLKDTVALIDRDESLKIRTNDTAKNVTKNVETEYYLQNDSMVFSIIRIYNLKIPNDNRTMSNESSDTQVILGLLNEYNELPSGAYDLHFVSSIFYSPSEVDQNIYDYIYDLDDIVVLSKERNYKVEYSYNQGSLRSKTEYKSINLDRPRQKEIIVREWNLNKSGQQIQKELIKVDTISE